MFSQTSIPCIVAQSIKIASSAREPELKPHKLQFQCAFAKIALLYVNRKPLKLDPGEKESLKLRVHGDLGSLWQR